MPEAVRRNSCASGNYRLSTASYQRLMKERLMRLILYIWVLPTSLLGLILVAPALFGGGGVQWVDGVLEVHGGVVAFFLRRVVGLVLRGGASAMTLGHVVIGVDKTALERTRAHERIHVRQCERWGPFFIPAYFLASGFQIIRGRRAYEDNPFEREAYESDGGL
jgi:hypothetical protein